MRRHFRASLASLALAVLCTPALAALTDSERAQVRQFVQAGRPGTETKVRSLLGRPDLSEDEAAAALSEGVKINEFDAARASYMRELLFGQASSAARSPLVPAVVRALLARAEVTLSAHPNDFSDFARDHRKETDELVALEAFMSGAIANAGHPSAEGHDVSVGIESEALQHAYSAVAQLVQRYPAVYRYDHPLSAEAAAVRAQGALTLTALGRGLALRTDTAQQLGLTESRKLLFEKQGLLVEDCGALPEARLATVARAWESVPHLEGVDLLWIAKAAPGSISTRGGIALAGFEAAADKASPASPALWPPDAQASRPDPLLSQVLFEAARFATLRALSGDAALLAHAKTALERVQRAGEQGVLASSLLGKSLQGNSTIGLPEWPASLLTHTTRLLLVDAPRVIDLAFSRFLAGRPEPLEQMLLAMQILSAKSGDDVLVRGARTLASGELSPTELTSLQLDPSGMVSGFLHDGHRYAFTWRDGAVVEARRDAKPITQNMLSAVRLPTAFGETWSDGSRVLRRLVGHPRVGLDGSSHVLVRSEKQSEGFDAVAFAVAPGDVRMEAEVVVAGGGGVGLHGVAGEKGYVGVVVLFARETKSTARIVYADGSGRGSELEHPFDLPSPGLLGHHLKITERGRTLEVQVDDVHRTVTLPEAAEHGSPFVTVRPGGELELLHLTIEQPRLPVAKPPATNRPPPKAAPSGGAPHS